MKYKTPNTIPEHWRVLWGSKIDLLRTQKKNYTTYTKLGFAELSSLSLGQYKIGLSNRKCMLLQRSTWWWLKQNHGRLNSLHSQIRDRHHLWNISKQNTIKYLWICVLIQAEWVHVCSRQHRASTISAHWRFLWDKKMDLLKTQEWKYTTDTDQAVPY